MNVSEKKAASVGGELTLLRVGTSNSAIKQELQPSLPTVENILFFLTLTWAPKDLTGALNI